MCSLLHVYHVLRRSAASCNFNLSTCCLCLWQGEIVAVRSFGVILKLPMLGRDAFLHMSNIAVGRGLFVCGRALLLGRFAAPLHGM